MRILILYFYGVTLFQAYKLDLFYFGYYLIPSLTSEGFMMVLPSCHLLLLLHKVSLLIESRDLSSSTRNGNLEQGSLSR